MLIARLVGACLFLLLAIVSGADDALDQVVEAQEGNNVTALAIEVGMRSPPWPTPTT